MNYLFKFNEKDFNEEKKKHTTTGNLSFATSNRSFIASSFRINIKSYETVSGMGVALKGDISSGNVHKGDAIRFNGQPGRVESIETYGKTVDIAGFPYTSTYSTYGDVTILISGIENEVIYTGDQVIDIIKQNNIRKTTEPSRIRNSGPYRSVVDYSSIKARRVMKKPAVPFSYYDLTTDGKSQLMEAIISQIKSTVSDGRVFYDTKGNPSRFETKHRVYYTVKDHAETYGLLACVDVKDNNWLTNLKRIISDYINCYAGQFEPSVVTVIVVDPVDDAKHLNTLENSIRELLKSFNIYDSGFCPVIFWGGNNVMDTKHEESQTSKSIIKVLEEIDRCFETPYRK